MGCGWLGLPLAISLIGKGHKVSGTTTLKDKLPALENAGIIPYSISVSEAGIDGPIAALLEDSEILIINIPPKLRGAHPGNYIRKMEHLQKAIGNSALKNIIFISSTSVYGADQGRITEKTTARPTSEAGRQLLVSEQLFQQIPNIETTIIRFAGLIGEDRHPITMLSGKKGLKNGDCPVNLIHLDDCIGIIEAVIKKNWWGEILNAAYPLHPTKKEYYHRIAQQRGLIPPQYGQNSNLSGKIIDSSKLIRVKKYAYKTSILQ